MEEFALDMGQSANDAASLDVLTKPNEGECAGGTGNKAPLTFVDLPKRKNRVKYVIAAQQSRWREGAFRHVTGLNESSLLGYPCLRASTLIVLIYILSLPPIVRAQRETYGMSLQQRYLLTLVLLLRSMTKMPKLAEPKEKVGTCQHSDVVLCLMLLPRGYSYITPAAPRLICYLQTTNNIHLIVQPADSKSNQRAQRRTSNIINHVQRWYCSSHGSRRCARPFHRRFSRLLHRSCCEGEPSRSCCPCW